MKRVIFNNIVLKKDDKSYMLMNLISFRRKLIDNEELMCLYTISEKKVSNKPLNRQENELYQRLSDEKQILSDDLIKQYDTHKEKEAADDLGSCRPISSIMLSPTLRCNFNCEYCYERELSDKTASMTKENIDAIYDFLIEYHERNGLEFNLKHVTCTGGEPLLEENIDIINYIFTKFTNSKFVIFTNGSTIMKVKDYIDFTKFDKVQVSLDGIEQTMMSINGVTGPVFYNVLNGIIYLMELGVKIDIAVTYTKKFLPIAKEFFELLKSKNIIGNKNVEFAISPAFDFTSNNTVDEKIYSLSEYLDITTKLRAITAEYGLTVAQLRESGKLFNSINRKANERVTEWAYRCEKSGYPLVFGPNGKIYWCIMVDPEAGAIGEYYPDKYFDYDRLHLLAKKSIFSVSKCRGCDYRYICGSGCTVFISTKQNNNEYIGHCGLFNNNYFIDNLEEFLGI